MNAADDQFWNTTRITKFDFDDILGSSLEQISLSGDSSSGEPSDLNWPASSCAGSPQPDTSTSEPETSGAQENSLQLHLSSLGTRAKSFNHGKIHEKYDGKIEKLNYYDTINRLINCEVACLDHFRSKNEKINLLDAALSSNDGNAILTVVLYLKQSLCRSIFLDVIRQSKPTAVAHYIDYLKSSCQYDELQLILLCFNRKQDAALIEYKRASESSDPIAKLNRLKFLRDKFSLDGDLRNEYETICEHHSLLQRQLAIQTSDSKSSNVAHSPFPKIASIVDQSLLTTLYYCCLYNFDSTAASAASPIAIKNEFKLTEKQFTITALKTLSRQRRWLDIEKLFVSKTLLGISQFKAAIPIERIIELLAKNGASPEVLSFYIRHESALDKKFELAKRYGCHQIVVDCFVATKNRIGLIDYVAKTLEHKSPAYFYADSSLRNSNIKWKN